MGEQGEGRAQPGPTILFANWASWRSMGEQGEGRAQPGPTILFANWASWRSMGEQGEGRVAYSTVLTTDPDNPGTVGNDGSIGSMNVSFDPGTYNPKASHISPQAMIFKGSENLRLDATPSLGSIRLTGDILQNNTPHSIPVEIYPHQSLVGVGL